MVKTGCVNWCLFLCVACLCCSENFHSTMGRSNHVLLSHVFLLQTQKYDFIINKLVAAVDAEFTLLNNKLAMQQQQPSMGEQY